MGVPSEFEGSTGVRYNPLGEYGIGSHWLSSVFISSILVCDPAAASEQNDGKGQSFDPEMRARIGGTSYWGLHSRGKAISKRLARPGQ